MLCDQNAAQQLESEDPNEIGDIYLDIIEAYIKKGSICSQAKAFKMHRVSLVACNQVILTGL